MVDAWKETENEKETRSQSYTEKVIEFFYESNEDNPILSDVNVKNLISEWSSRPLK